MTKFQNPDASAVPACRFLGRDHASPIPRCPSDAGRHAFPYRSSNASLRETRPQRPMRACWPPAISLFRGRTPSAGRRATAAYLSASEPATARPIGARHSGGIEARAVSLGDFAIPLRRRERRPRPHDDELEPGRAWMPHDRRALQAWRGLAYMSFPFCSSVQEGCTGYRRLRQGR